MGETLMRIARLLHEQTRKLEVAVEGTYAGESGDPRVRLLSDSLRVSRVADLELGRLNQTAQRVLGTLQEQLGQGLQAFAPPGIAEQTINFDREREALNTSISNLKRQRNELETLYEIARVLNSTLDLDSVLQLVMDQVIHVVNAERGFLMLKNRSTGALEFTIARDKQARTIDKSEFKVSMRTIERVVRTREPLLTDDAQMDAALKGQESIMAYGIRSIMCVPLIVRNDCIGAVYVDSRINANLFGPKHRDLLMAFCHTAAIAVDNARLFADLNRTLRKINEDKQYMDNIFGSIGNGVITTDSSGIVTTVNNAAGIILNLNPREAVGKHYREAFACLPQVKLVEMLSNATVEQTQDTIVPRPIECDIAGRGHVYLSISVSSLRDTQQNSPIGTVLVVEDRTELERQRAKVSEIRNIFGRFVHPNVVSRLIEDPMALNLGGEIKEISVISADVRGFTSMSERMSSQEVMTVLNNYLDRMVKEIWDEGGTITGFWGDELLAIFNAPLQQEDHALRAVRAVWKMRQAVLDYQRMQPNGIPISFGFGVNTGEAMVGNIGSRERIQNYTAIGDAVNVAARLQKKAEDNNIWLNHTTFTRVRQLVRVEKLPPVGVKNKAQPLDVWCLTGWVS
jgi:class 3 adenylate cyclase/PAS domain-containing protein